MGRGIYDVGPFGQNPPLVSEGFHLVLALDGIENFRCPLPRKNMGEYACLKERSPLQNERLCHHSDG